jgi:hypothetical protein
LVFDGDRGRKLEASAKSMCVHYILLRSFSPSSLQAYIKVTWVPLPAERTHSRRTRKQS